MKRRRYRAEFLAWQRARGHRAYTFNPGTRIRASTAGACTLATLIAGCGGHAATAKLTITVTKPPASRLRYALTCAPAGGSVSNPQALCRTLRLHPNMLFPPRLTGSCLGSYGIPPQVGVTGRYRGRRVAFTARSCDEPASRGQAAALWLHALDHVGG
jgi:hypothetical protein